MISILLIILKIIGITLLVVLGLFLFLFLVVLFVPVRYRFKGNYDDSFHCKGKVTWLLQLVSIKVEVKEGVVTSIRILGIPLSIFLKNKKKDILSPEEEKQDNHNQSKDRVESVAKQEDAKPQLEQKKSQTLESVEDEMDVKELQNENSQVDSITAEMSVIQTKKKSIIQKFQDIYNTIKQKIKDIIHKIRNVIQKIKDFILSSKDKKKQLKRYLKILQSDTTKAAFALCKNKIFKMLKHIFPRKLHVDFKFGFEDPATTGYTLAVYGMLPKSVGKCIILHPDFDNPVFEGQFKVKGAICAFTLLCQVLSILMDRNCRKLYHIVKKEISNEHK